MTLPGSVGVRVRDPPGPCRHALVAVAFISSLCRGRLDLLAEGSKPLGFSLSLTDRMLSLMLDVLNGCLRLRLDDSGSRIGSLCRGMRVNHFAMQSKHHGRVNSMRMLFEPVLHVSLDERVRVISSHRLVLLQAWRIGAARRNASQGRAHLR